MVKVKKVERRVFSLEEKQKILNKTSCKCAHCGKKLTTDTMTVEHIYPLNKGGTHDYYNLIALCQACNNLKSNFIYDIHWYNYIEDVKERAKHKLELSRHIFSNSTDRDILGSTILESYLVPYSISNKIMGARPKNRYLLAQKLSIPVELRPMYPGDIDDEVVKFLKDDIMKFVKNTFGEEVNPDELEINKYKLIEMQRTCSFYGLYRDNKIVGIKVYISLEQLDEVSKEFTDEIHKRGFNKTFVHLISAIKENYKPVLARLEKIEQDYMALTNNLVLYGSEKPDIMKAIGNSKPICMARLKPEHQILSGEFSKIINSITLTLDNDDYNESMKAIDDINSMINYLDSAE